MVKCLWKEHSFCRFYRSWLFFTPGFHIVILLLFNPQAVSFAFQVFLAFHYKEWKQNRKYAKKLNIKLQKYVNLSLQKGWLYLKLKLLVFPTHIKWQMAGIISKFFTRDVSYLLLYTKKWETITWSNFSWSKLCFITWSKLC